MSFERIRKGRRVIVIIILPQKHEHIVTCSILGYAKIKISYLEGEYGLQKDGLVCITPLDMIWM